ncbi:hypothetical protein O181_057239, partial [Austropuccinia psidii MF-1]|nr:hypothetical protein [Austropuccinia psidii MF-1]
LFLDLFLYGLIVPVLPFILRDRLHLSQDQLQNAASLLLASHAIATFFSAPLIGLSIDGSMSRKQGFLFGLLVTLGATILLCFGDTILLLVVARLLQGASAAIVWVVGLAIVTDTVEKNHLGKALGAVYSVTTFGALVSPTIGGLVYTKYGYYPVYILAGTLLSIDIILRLCVIDKEQANFYYESLAIKRPSSTLQSHERLSFINSQTNTHQDIEEALENVEDNSRPKSSLPSASPSLRFPLLAILSDSRLLAATFLTFTHACFVGMFNATLPIHVEQVFGMTSLESGLLFIAIELPYIVCGPAIGWYVDHAGPRGPASMGAILLVPSLFALRFPTVIEDIPLLIVLLALNGVGLSATSSSAFIQANKIGRERHLKDPILFGKKGPYGQLYALNNVLYSLGMTLGPLWAGTLTDNFGYGNSMAVMSFHALLAAISSRIWMEK